MQQGLINVGVAYPHFIPGQQALDNFSGLDKTSDKEDSQIDIQYLKR